MATYFFGSPVEVDIRLEGEDARKQVEVKLEKERKESCPVYFDGESVIGQVKLRMFFAPYSPKLKRTPNQGHYTRTGREETRTRWD